MSMTGKTFVCPHCDRPHVTLGSLLACHPRETRALTGALDTGKAGALADANIKRFRQLLDGTLGPAERAHLVGLAAASLRLHLSDMSDRDILAVIDLPELADRARAS